MGSPYEFHNYRDKGFDPLFHESARFTDDTVCTIAVADAIMNGVHPEDALVKWCRLYAENGGWGKQFALWFMSDQRAPYNSWGNGAAMRISPVGFRANTEEQAADWADEVSAVTHNHPEAIASAQAVALCVFWGTAENQSCRNEVSTERSIWICSRHTHRSYSSDLCSD